MPFFDATRRPHGRTPSGPRALAASRTPRGEHGFLLIEVMISALLVALIVVATFTGFDVINRTTGDQRIRNEAAALAAQSQEQLRSTPASTLELLAATPRAYTQTIGGTTFKIHQTASLNGQSGSSASCNATETSRQSANSFTITTTVQWPQQVKKHEEFPKNAHWEPIVASSSITPPTGSGLEVDAYTGPNHEAGVPGITAVVTYTPIGTSSTTSIEETTGSGGCAVFASIPATTATVAIKEKPGYVTVAGAATYPTKEVTLAPNYTTHYPVVYDAGGAVEAQFRYKGTTAYKHKNNAESGEYTEPVIYGDTFVAANATMEAKPNYNVGSVTYGPGTASFEPQTGTYAALATSKLNLFPFPLTEKHWWQVYAGDCPENNPEAFKITPAAEVVVKATEATQVAVPMSYVKLNVYSKTERETAKLTHAWEGLATSEKYHVTITNTKCASYTAPNDEIADGAVHADETTTGTEDGGHLAFPFQPFGKEFQLTLTAGANKYTPAKYNLESEAGTTLNIYLGQRSAAQKAEATKAEEAAQKTAEAAWLANQKKTVREPREATEATQRATWKTEYEKGKISKKTYESDLTTQTASRKTAEEKEASEAKAQRTKELEAEEKARVKRETEESEEASKTKVTVE